MSEFKFSCPKCGPHIAYDENYIFVAYMVWFRFSPLSVRHVCGTLAFWLFILAAEMFQPGLTSDTVGLYHGWRMGLAAWAPFATGLSDCGLSRISRRQSPLEPFAFPR